MPVSRTRMRLADLESRIAHLERTVIALVEHGVDDSALRSSILDRFPRYVRTSRTGSDLLTLGHIDSGKSLVNTRKVIGALGAVTQLVAQTKQQKDYK